MVALTISLSEMQTLELEILKSIHQFCEDKGLRYSLAYGSLLGAVRHKGFIPWDDDIDIIMPRPDYEVFLSEYSSEIYKVASLRNTDYLYPYAKVYDTRTDLEEQLRHVYPDMGVFVDIFPIDGLPSSSKSWKRKNFKQVLFYKLYMSMNYHLSTEWTIQKNLLLLIGRIIEVFYGPKKILNRLNKNAQQVLFGEAKSVGMFLGDGPLVAFDAQSFEQRTLISFEDCELYAIDNYDLYLRKQYGDYMQVPPVELQKSEHRYTLRWKASIENKLTNK